MGRKPKDLSGQKFGMLTVKDMTKKRDGRGSVYWHCVCDCGNEVDVPAARLIQGTCHSCGCLQKKNRKIDTFIILISFFEWIFIYSPSNLWSIVSQFTSYQIRN